MTAFHDLYADAGRPGTRTLASGIARNENLPARVSHETLAALLHGKAVPDWLRLQAAVLQLTTLSFRRPDPDDAVARFHAMWLAERDDPGTPPSAKTSSPQPGTEVQPDLALRPRRSSYRRTRMPQATGATVHAIMLPPDSSVLVPAQGEKKTARLDARGTRLAAPPVTLALADRAFSADRRHTDFRLLPIVGTGPIRAVAFSPDGSRLATAGRMVLLWDSATRKPIGGAFVAHSEPAEARAVAFSPDGSLLATAGGSTARLWDPTTRQLVGELPADPDGDLYAVAFSPDGSLLATAGGSTARLWDPTTRQLVGELPADPDGDLYAVAFSPDGSLLATTGRSATRLWDPTTRQPVGKPLPAHANTVVFSPDGSLIATAGSQMIQLWDTFTCSLFSEPLGDLASRGYNQVTFSPDGLLLATSSGGTVRLSHPATNKTVGEPLTSRTDGWVVGNMAFSPDGTVLAAATGQDSVLRWSVPVVQ